MEEASLDKAALAGWASPAEAAASAAARPRTIIKPHSGWAGIDWREIWRYRELLYFLTWRDVKVRYKQTVLGILWAFIQPFVQLVVYTFVFHNLAKIDTEGTRFENLPYAMVLYAGLIPWMFFRESLSRSSQSVVASPGLITKVFFPRLIIPLSSVGACLMDFAIYFVILIGLSLYYGVAPAATALAVLPLVVLTICAAVGVGSFLSALNVAYRDFRYIIPFMVEIWFFLTPVAWVPDKIEGEARWLIYLNPMAGIVDGFRSAIFGRPFAWGLIAVSLTMTAAAFLVGAVYFRRIERQFADLI
jgi:lipopolysaccharide transport system permease protein